MRSAGTAESWTCTRCDVTVSFLPDAKAPRMPSTWAEVDGSLHCLDCRREHAGEEGLAKLSDDIPPGERQKLRSHARIEFEIGRDPERPDNQIAKCCSTSVVAVRKARGRMGLVSPDPTPQPQRQRPPA